MKLASLIDRKDNHLETIVTSFAVDHRKVAPGTIFGAFKGAHSDGADFIDKAVAAGAVAVVADPAALVAGAVHITANVPRQAFAQLAARFYGPYPANRVAVTGTNGKTSTVEFTRQLWSMAGHKAAAMGTLGLKLNDSDNSEETSAVHLTTPHLTTPDAVTFLASMTRLAKKKVTHTAFEASSHGLDQYRIAALPVAAAAFTGLSRDHLDYHASMETYFAAKMRLFTDLLEEKGTAVIWADNDYAPQVADLAASRGLRLLTIGQQGTFLRIVSLSPVCLGSARLGSARLGSARLGSARLESARLGSARLESARLGQLIRVAANGREYEISLPLIGAFQVANALVAAGLVIALGGDVEATLESLQRLSPVPGRLEQAAITASGAPVYVDYAHTPQALCAALAALRAHTRGRVILVFGAGGERDQGKRAAMGRVASSQADHVIITDDNPRSEPPVRIRQAIREGAPDAVDIGNRREAIASAIAAAGPEDSVCIAGKGHEQGQIFGSGENVRTEPFDDVAMVRECVRDSVRDSASECVRDSVRDSASECV